MTVQDRNACCAGKRKRSAPLAVRSGPIFRTRSRGSPPCRRVAEKDGVIPRSPVPQGDEESGGEGQSAVRRRGPPPQIPYPDGTTMSAGQRLYQPLGDAPSVPSGLNISSTACPKTSPILKASGRLGSYFRVSMAFTVWRDTPNCSARSAWDQSRSARRTLRRFLNGTASG